MDDGDDELARALELAYRQLGRRDRSEEEVRRHLLRRGVEPTQANGAVDRLREQGYLDDARFAQRFAADRRTLDGWGSARIEAALRAAGIAPEHVEAACGGRGGEEELAAALALLRRRLALPPGDDHERQRALALLVRRGFELELAYAAVRRFTASPAPL